MRKSNRPLLIALAALMLLTATAAAVWEQTVLTPPAETPAVTETPCPTPEPTPTPPSALAGKLRVTELMEKNRACLRDGDGDFPDWIELTNLSDAPLSLAGVRISDRADRRGWELPDRTLSPGERLVLFASRKDRRGEELHTDFALSASDCVVLFDGLGLVIDSVPCRGAEADTALALNPAGDWAESLYPTPGFDNSSAGYDALQETQRPAGPLVISEAAVKNLSLYIAGSSYDCDWVEIKNISDAPVRLSDYYLSDRNESPFLWQLPDENLGPGKEILFVCEQPGSGFYGSTPCTGFSLNSSREQLYLTSRSEELIDWLSLRDIPPGGSYGRMDGEAGCFYFAAPTPNAANRNGLRRVSAMPVCLTEDGVFDGVESVTLALAGRGVLRYTVNDSAPTEESEIYTGPIEISKTSVVSVRCYEDGALPSRPLVLSYIMNEGHTLPVVSFVAEDFKEFSGNYSGGNKMHEMPGSLSLYRAEDRFTVNCGVTLNGETSLSMTKKNMAVRFRGVYGAASLEHDIFGGGACSFSSLLLRAGQDQFQCVIRNELAQSLADLADTAVVNQRSIFCVLYLNGEYAGLYTLKERPNAALYAAVAGVDPDSVECFEAPAAYGSEFYDRTIGYVNKNDMTTPESYDSIFDYVDADSLIDWFFMEGFCANTDLTMGNLRYARSSENDGRWRLLFYDLDAAFRSYSSIQTNLLNGFGATHIQVAAYTVPLMKNELFRDRFLTRAAELLRGPLTNEAVLAEIDRMADEIRPEIPRDFGRYNRSVASWDKNLEELRSMIRDGDWQQANIDALAKAFNLDKETRAQYFGDIDHPAEKH